MGTAHPKQWGAPFSYEASLGRGRLIRRLLLRIRAAGVDRLSAVLLGFQWLFKRESKSIKLLPAWWE